MNGFRRKSGIEQGDVIFRKSYCCGTTIFLQPGDTASAGNDDKVLITAKEPSQGRLGRRTTVFVCNCLHNSQES